MRMSTSLPSLPNSTRKSPALTLLLPMKPPRSTMALQSTMLLQSTMHPQSTMPSQSTMPPQLTKPRSLKPPKLEMTTPK
ncbi:uncharacterized protein BKA78DRAFT_323114 [Phyllosticta capitalensis]|uniref:uncharacterized protein n=1 Tax=Phyllosticta capitalensis TaxID=121624 RepID=UPI00313166BF